jgi:uncharacterized protein
MKRSIDRHLDAWLSQNDRKPLILLGARQIGKTYSIKEFGARRFSVVHELNFQSNRKLHKIFSGNLDPIAITRQLELMLEQPISVNGDHLLFFDEIQHCPDALTSLKYFCERLPNLALVAAGSLLGLHLSPASFPVGKVDIMYMYPMSFQEFMDAAGSSREQEIFREGLTKPKSVSAVAHEKFWDLFKCYLNTGGLPESINTWVSHGGTKGGIKAFSASRTKLAALVTSYVSDINKHAGKMNAMHIERVWRQVAQHLATAQDGATEKFKFKDVLPGVNSYRQLAGPIDCLQTAAMIINAPICHSIATPLKAYTKPNMFKLYMFD